MKAKELIEKLKGIDPEMEICIEQGGHTDYMLAYTLEKKDLVLEDDLESELPSVMTVVCITFK